MMPFTYRLPPPTSLAVLSCLALPMVNRHFHRFGVHRSRAALRLPSRPVHPVRGPLRLTTAPKRLTPGKSGAPQTGGAKTRILTIHFRE